MGDFFGGINGAFFKVFNHNAYEKDKVKNEEKKAKTEEYRNQAQNRTQARITSDDNERNIADGGNMSDADIQRMQNSVSTNETELGNIDNQKSDLQNKQTTVEGKIADATKNVDSLSNAISQLKKPEKGSGEDADAQYEKDMQVYEQKLSELQSQLEKAQADVDKLKNEQNITKSQLDQLTSTSDKLTNEINNLKQQIQQKEGELANDKLTHSESQTKLNDDKATYESRDINYMGEFDNKENQIQNHPLLKDSIALEGQQMQDVLKAIKMDSNIAEVRGDHVLLKDGTFGKVSVTQNGDVAFTKTDSKTGKSKVYDLTNMEATIKDTGKTKKGSSDDKTTNPMADSFKETTTEDKSRNYSSPEVAAGLNKNPQYISLSKECDKLSDELGKIDKNKEPEKWQKKNDELYQKQALQTTMLNYGVAKYEGKDSYYDIGMGKEVDFKTGKPVEKEKTIEIKQKNKTGEADKTTKSGNANGAEKSKAKKLSDYSQPDQLKLLNREAYRLGKEIDDLKKEDFASDTEYEAKKTALKAQKKQIEKKFDKLADNINGQDKISNPKAKYDTYKAAMQKAEAERKEIVKKSKADYPNAAEYEKAERKRDELGKLIETYKTIADKVKTTYDYSHSFDD